MNKTNYPQDLIFSVSRQSGLLDFLLLNVIGKSRNNIKSLLTHGEVTVDGKVVKRHDYALQPGQVVCIKKRLSRTEEFKKDLDIIYEDADFIAINKPAGLVTVATDSEKEKTAYHILTEYVKQKNRSNRIFVVHRLDRETSGVVLFAKNEQVKTALQDGWSELVLEREYMGIVEGELAQKSGRIKSWLRQTKTLMMYSSMTPGDGLEAVTNYCVIKEAENYSVLAIHLETGRKNQIRVHMKDIKHSIAGDKKYGAKTDPLKRLCLHASTLELKHPFSGKIMRFEAPLPSSFTAMMGKITTSSRQDS